MQRIMRESDRKNKSGMMEDGRPRPSEIVCARRAKTPVLQTYTGVTRKLISTATAEWVNAPTEIKSTPVSA